MKKFKTILLLAIGIVLGSVGTFSINQMFENSTTQEETQNNKTAAETPKVDSSTAESETVKKQDLGNYIHDDTYEYEMCRDGYEEYLDYVLTTEVLKYSNGLCILDYNNSWHSMSEIAEIVNMYKAEEEFGASFNWVDTSEMFEEMVENGDLPEDFFEYY